jgi:hypothetical protein
MGITARARRLDAPVSPKDHGRGPPLAKVTLRGRGRGGGVRILSGKVLGDTRPHDQCASAELQLARYANELGQDQHQSRVLRELHGYFAQG